MIGVTGASGQLGQLVVSQLKAKGVPAKQIVAIVRNPDKAKSLGVTIRAADYDQPAALTSALAGVEKVLLISSSEMGKRTAQHKNVINAAKAAGVKLLAYTSLLHADTSILNLAGEHKETEQAIQASGLPFTLLRNGWYIENYTGSVQAALQYGVLNGAAGAGKIAGAARADYAAAAVAVLTGKISDVAGHTYELAGDQPFTLAEMAAEVAKQAGKPNIHYQHLSQADFAKALSAVFPAWLAEAFASWDAAAEKNALFDDSHTLSKLIGRPTTALKDGVATMLRSAAHK